MHWTLLTVAQNNGHLHDRLTQHPGQCGGTWVHESWHHWSVKGAQCAECRASYSRAGAGNGTHAGRNDALVNFKKVNHEVHNCFTFEGTPRIVNAYYFWIIDTTSSWGMPNQWILYGSHTETPDISNPQDHPWVVLDVRYGKDSQYWQEKSNDPSYSNDSGSTDWTKAVKYCFPNDVAYKHYTLCWVGNNAYAKYGASYGIKHFQKIYINELALVWEPDLVFDSSYSIFGPDSP